MSLQDHEPKLLTIPREIRNQILTYVLLSRSSLRPSTLLSGTTHLSDPEIQKIIAETPANRETHRIYLKKLPSRFHPASALIYTCRLLCHETLDQYQRFVRTLHDENGTSKVSAPILHVAMLNSNVCVVRWLQPLFLHIANPLRRLSQDELSIPIVIPHLRIQLEFAGLYPDELRRDIPEPQTEYFPCDLDLMKGSIRSLVDAMLGDGTLLGKLMLRLLTTGKIGDHSAKDDEDEAQRLENADPILKIEHLQVEVMEPSLDLIQSPGEPLGIYPKRDIFLWWRMGQLPINLTWDFLEEFIEECIHRFVVSAHWCADTKNRGKVHMLSMWDGRRHLWASALVEKHLIHMISLVSHGEWKARWNVKKGSRTRRPIIMPDISVSYID